MEPPRQKWAARIALIIAAGVVLTWFLRTDFRRKISSDILDLIPTGERNPELAIVRSLAAEQRTRVALFDLHLAPAEPHRAEAADAFVAALRQSPAFADVTPMWDTTARDELGKTLFERRLDLLLPQWLERRRAQYEAAKSDKPWPEWLAETTAEELEMYLAKPEAVAFQDELASDPLRLIPELVDSVRSLAPSSNVRSDRVLVWARTTESPLQPEGQQPVFDAVAGALAVAQRVAPNATLQWTSLARFAAESRHRIERELSLLNVLSLVAVLGVAALCLRRLTKCIHLVPVVLGAVLGAWVATTLVFDRVHALVFVVGSLLAGVAIDYGFYLYLQPPLFASEPYVAKARRLLKPLLASALTTIIGFSLLLFSDLPLIRQLGVFVSAGLICALATALVWFAQLDVTFIDTRPFARWRVSPSPRSQRLTRWLLAVGAAIALFGPLRLRWRDNIRDLEIPSPALEAEATAVRADFGEGGGSTVFITYGADLASVRQHLEAFAAWHRGTSSGAPLASLGLLLPTSDAWERLPAEVTALGVFPAQLRDALQRHGFEAAGFEAFFAEWDRWRQQTPPSYETLGESLAGAVHGPLGALMSIRPGTCWFASIAPEAKAAEPPPATATVSINQLETLNRLFVRYRVSALQLSSIGLALVGLSVFVLYGLRRGIRTFAIPSGACLFTFGVFGLISHPLNLFHLLGAFLGVCLSHNYAIFSAENALRGEAAPPSIRMSATTTAASFGVLALSHIPVVSALGTTVALIVISALFIVESEPLAFPSHTT
jgi:predicted exporter